VRSSRFRPCPVVFIPRGRASRGAGYPLRVIAHAARSFHPGQVQTDRMNAHIEAGGAIAFCPEGGMNKAPG